MYPTQNGAPVADLTQSDFEVLDNGVRQTVEQFERVVVRAAGPQETRIEPNTVRESRSMLESSRARVFVLFLDIGHVGVGGSYNIRKPLVDALDKVIGADDLVGLMTPDMSARDVAFGRKTTTIDGILSRYRFWGERGRLNPVDPQEQLYEQCYPPLVYPGIAAQMIARRREKMTLDGLHDLVRFLRGVREERKAVLAITEGWLLYRPDPTLARPLDGPVPSGPAIGVDPRGGRLTPWRSEEPGGGIRAAATPSGFSSRRSMTTRSSGSCWPKPIAPIPRSIRSIRAAWRCSTRTSVRMLRLRCKSTPPCSVRG